MNPSEIPLYRQAEILPKSGGFALFAAPDMAAHRFEQASAAEIMRAAGDEIVGEAVAGIEMRGIGLIGGIDRNKDALAVIIALQNALLIGQHRNSQVAVAESLTALVCLSKPCNQRGQFIEFRLVEAGTQCRVAVLFVAVNAPFAAVVYARDTGHPEQQRIDQRQMGRIGENACDAGHIVIVGKIEQMQTAVHAPLLRAEAVFERVADLKEVHRIEAGIQTLVALIIRRRMEHFGINPAGVVAVQQFTDQEQIGAQFLGKAAERPQEIEIQGIGDIEPDAVDAEKFDPVFHSIENMRHHGGIAEIELNKLEMPLPALIPEAVVIAGIAVKIGIEPVLVGGIPFFLANIPELRKAASDMIEHAVEHDADALCVQCIDDLSEVLVRAEAGVDFFVVAGVIAVGIGLEHRRKIHSIAAGFGNVVNPVQHLQDAMCFDAVIAERRSAESQRINLVEYGLAAPVVILFHNIKPFCFYLYCVIVL